MSVIVIFRSLLPKNLAKKSPLKNFNPDYFSELHKFLENFINFEELLSSLFPLQIYQNYTLWIFTINKGIWNQGNNHDYCLEPSFSIKVHHKESVLKNQYICFLRVLQQNHILCTSTYTTFPAILTFSILLNTFYIRNLSGTSIGSTTKNH